MKLKIKGVETLNNIFVYLFAIASAYSMYCEKTESAILAILWAILCQLQGNKEKRGD